MPETGKTAETMVAEVRERYGEIAETSGSCCGPKAAPCCGGTEEPMSLHIGYRKKDLAAVPEGADLGLGCGAPIALLELKPGETALDLGSGAGIDAFLAAQEVGPKGRVIGVDMTPQMLERARQNAASAGHANVEFREGRLEALPVDDATVDAVTSNCVINLVPDKPAVFGEVARVLKPGGRMVISDIVLQGTLPDAVRQDVASWVGCISGALQREEYVAMVEDAGFERVEVLKDVDYGASMEAVAPDQVAGILERTGAKRDDLVGTVRSVTLRAYKPA
jgi:SAM-dependent methyltransferase